MAYLIGTSIWTLDVQKGCYWIISAARSVGHLGPLLIDDNYLIHLLSLVEFS